MTVEHLPEWTDIPAASDRINDLMRQDTALINEAARLLDAGHYTDDTVDQLQDIWAESIDVEAKLTKARAPELDWLHRT
ncbi:hypothetical protein CH302_19200 [Rhodococcus sp. 15-2388-1-1a]|uniref:hypothetical protein n=1 Tax=Nocardiaceae TaxID=85025 RepID=UPI00055D03D7|nr:MULTISPECIES: hypothetical protein [Rhodococcus]OZE95069.1 hypothetical protein CH302_19200 [Rhodococcus sp. 15-2388-1-1a]